MDNQIRKQKTGGAIGLGATGSLSRVTMDMWIQEFRRKVESAGAKIWLLKKYVDDVLVLVDNLKPGTRLENNALVWKRSWEKEDLHSQK